MASSPDVRPPVVVVTGPTAAGKTPLAIVLALRFGGEIVNADSMQVYRYMDIGTAKPTPEQRAEVPHHMLEVVDPDQTYSAGRYAASARAVAEGIHGRGKIAFLTGGTGLYIRAFLEGLLVAGEADPELRARLEREHAEAQAAGDPDGLHRRLRECDPEAASQIHPRDVRRIIRALEIAQQSGSTASRLRREHRFGDRPYRSLHLALDPGRQELDRRIDRRCIGMIQAGLLRELRALRERGYGPELPSMQAIGYRHMTPVAEGRETLANAQVAMQRDTRRFARRQRTWLRKVPEAIWVEPSEEARISALVEAFLGAGQATGRPSARRT
jgi:tRNA dimethylallyltransferase